MSDNPFNNMSREELERLAAQLPTHRLRKKQEMDQLIASIRERWRAIGVSGGARLGKLKSNLEGKSDDCKLLCDLATVGSYLLFSCQEEQGHDDGRRGEGDETLL